VSAAAVIVIRRKQLVRGFREAGAVDREHAASLEQLCQRRSWIFDQMVRHGVFIETDPGQFFMDEQAAEEFLSERRTRALIVGGALLLILVVIWILGLLSG
jgi:hypothetical protein